MMKEDEKYMQRCLDLAALGAGSVSPNPMVGAVIVCNGEIIGQGWHKKYGKAHAEVNAVASVCDKSLFAQSTIYVSLEPCSHWGKTPPCAELLVRCGFKRCVIANRDPNPKVNGRGIDILKASGMKVECGVLAEQAWYLNRAFFTRQLLHRPYIILKYASSCDGFISPEQQGDYWLSNEPMQVWVHRLRSETDAIMAGYHTVEKDNPRLNVRKYFGTNPIRLTIDRNLSLDKNLCFFDHSQRTVVFNHLCDKSEDNLEYVRIMPERSEAEQVVEWLYRHEASTLVVEGGRSLLNKFIDSGLWDEIDRIDTPCSIGCGTPAPEIQAQADETITIGNNTLCRFFNRSGILFKSE